MKGVCLVVDILHALPRWKFNRDQGKTSINHLKSVNYLRTFLRKWQKMIKRRCIESQKLWQWIQWRQRKLWRIQIP
jgi:hypothetical protein